MNVDAVIQMGIEREIVKYTGEPCVAHTLVRTIEGLVIVQCHRITLQLTRLWGQHRHHGIQTMR